MRPSFRQCVQAVVKNVSCFFHHWWNDVICYQELEHKIITFMTDELKRLKKLLTHDYSESPCSEEDEDEEDQRDVRDGALKIAVHILRNMNQEIIAQQLEKCEIFTQNWVTEHFTTTLQFDSKCIEYFKDKSLCSV